MMLKRSLTLAIISFIFCSLTAQTKFSLVGEGTGTKVSVLYHIDTWSANLDGVNIKRRIIKKSGKAKNWELLNQTLLIPSNQLTKDLSNVTNNAKKVSELEKLRIRYFKNNGEGKTRIKAVSSAEFKNYYNDKELQKALKLMFKFDYDVALMFGCGYVDYDVPDAYAVEYGVFPVYKGEEMKEPSATYKWHVGDEPDLSVMVKKTKMKKRGSVINLEWDIDKKSLEANKYVSGFFVCRKPEGGEYEVLNERVIWLSTAGKKTAVSYDDRLTDLTKNYVYALVPVSSFKSFGPYYEKTMYSDLPDKTPAPVITTDYKYGYNFVRKGVELKWEFDPRLEDRIDGFIVSRGVGTSILDVLTDTLPPDTRVYWDKSLTPQEGIQKYYYTVKLLQTDSYSLESERLSLWYDPKPEPTVPAHLTATAEVVKGESVVHLSWTKDDEFRKQIKGYRIRSNFGGDFLAGDQTLPLIEGYNYDFKVRANAGKKFLFALSYVDKKGRKEAYADTIEVQTASFFIPFVEPKDLERSENTITVSWEYGDRYADLAGFRLFINGEMKLDEKTITAEKREWLLENLEPGKYHIKLQAVTQFGLTSKISPSGRSEIIKKE